MERHNLAGEGSARIAAAEERMRDSALRAGRGVMSGGKKHHAAIFHGTRKGAGA
jgi:hypothetical protein